MKQTFILLIAVFLFACADQTKEAPDSKVAGVTDTTTAKMDYAYTIEHPDQWITGSRENTKMVLQALKDYENGNIAACMNAFADSVHLSFDGLNQKFSKDSVQKMFTQDREQTKNFKIDMHDFESVKSNVTDKQYVSLWYVQKWENQEGKMDSVSVMDDLEIKNGKIISIDQKQRKYPKK